MDDKKIQEHLSRQDVVIEGSSATWEIHKEGEIQGTYTGSFRFRCFLTPTQRLAASREHRELLGNNPQFATEHDDNLAFTLSQLKYRIISAPPFWTSSGIPGDLPDESIIDAVLDAAVAAELKYKALLKKKKVESIQKAKEAAERMLKQRDEEDGENQEDGDQS